MTTASQLRAIHALRRAIPHFTDEDYRALLQKEFRVSSSKTLAERQAAKLIEMLKILAGQNGAVRRASETAEGPYAGKLRALWMSAHNLGLVRSRDDRAMLAFIKRQTKVDHTRFLVNAKDAAKAIEGLKAWITRDGGVEWPAREDAPIEAKRAVALAVAQRCVEAGAFTLFAPETLHSDLERYGYRVGVGVASFEFYTEEHWDRIANRLGARLRAKIADQSKRAA